MLSKTELFNLTHLFNPGEQRCKTLIIAEVAQTHDGSLGQAHAFIDAVARTGADAIKFQTHIAAAESTPAEPWRVKFSPQDDTRYQYWQRMAFSPDQWAGLKKHADEVGLLFLSSPFSLEAVSLLTQIGMPAWKIASGEINNKPMLEAMMATGQPLLLSTGMSPMDEIDGLVAWIGSKNHPLALLQCTSMYPTPAAHIGLNLIPVFQKRFAIPIGLSDHSGTIFPGLAAAALDSSILELHVTLSREMFGPDVIASITTSELTELVRGIRFIEAMRAGTADKDQLAAQVAPLRQLFLKSLVAKCDLPAGKILSREDFLLKKPGTGLPADALEQVIGKKLMAPLRADQQLRKDHLLP